jgi:hypothetical protein
LLQETGGSSQDNPFTQIRIPTRGEVIMLTEISIISPNLLIKIMA